MSDERDTVITHCSHVSSEVKDQISDPTRVGNHTAGILNVELKQKKTTIVENVSAHARNR